MTSPASLSKMVKVVDVLSDSVSSCTAERKSAVGFDRRQKRVKSLYYFFFLSLKNQQWSQTLLLQCEQVSDASFITKSDDSNFKLTSGAFSPPKAAGVVMVIAKEKRTVTYLHLADFIQVPRQQRDGQTLDRSSACTTLS